MHSLHVFGSRKENSSPGTPGGEQGQGFNTIQDGGLTKRFEELEKQLNRLESIRLSGGDPQCAIAAVQESLCRAESHPDATGSEKKLCGTIPGRLDRQVDGVTHDGTAARQKNIRSSEPPLATRQVTISEPFACMDRLPERYPPALLAQLGALQAQTIHECRVEMARLSHETIEEARCRLNSLANEVAAQMAQSLERQVEAATCHTAAAVLGCARSVAAQLAIGPRIQQLSDGTSPSQGAQAYKGDLAQALPPAVKKVQNRSAVLLDDLQGQLQNVLHSFQEKAARQVAEEFRNIAGELLQREIRQLQIKGLAAKIEQPSESLWSQPEPGSSRAPERAGALAQKLASFWPGSNAQGSRRLHREVMLKETADRPHSNAPKWRILGLGL